MKDEALQNKIKELSQHQHQLFEQKKLLLEQLHNLELEENRNTQKFRDTLTHNIFFEKQYIISKPLYFGKLKKIEPLVVNDFHYTAFLNQQPGHHDYQISHDFDIIQYVDLSSVFKLLSEYQDIDELSQNNPESFNQFFSPGKFFILKSFNQFKQISQFIIIKM